MNEEKKPNRIVKILCVGAGLIAVALLCFFSSRFSWFGVYDGNASSSDSSVPAPATTAPVSSVTTPQATAPITSEQTTATTTTATTTTAPETTVPETTTVETTTTAATTTTVTTASVAATTTKTTTEQSQSFSGTISFRRIPDSGMIDRIYYDIWAQNLIINNMGYSDSFSYDLGDGRRGGLVRWCVYSDDGSYEITSANYMREEGEADYSLIDKFIVHLESRRKELDKHIEEVYASDEESFQGDTKWFPKEFTVKSDKGTYLMTVTGVREFLAGKHVTTAKGRIDYTISVNAKKIG